MSETFKEGDILIVYKPFSTLDMRANSGDIFVVVNVYPARFGNSIDMLGSLGLIPWREGWGNIQSYIDNAPDDQSYA